MEAIAVKLDIISFRVRSRALVPLFDFGAGQYSVVNYSFHVAPGPPNSTLVNIQKASYTKQLPQQPTLTQRARSAGTLLQQSTEHSTLVITVTEEFIEDNTLSFKLDRIQRIWLNIQPKAKYSASVVLIFPVLSFVSLMTAIQSISQKQALTSRRHYFLGILTSPHDPASSKLLQNLLVDMA
ncbi:hypothetical protein Tco_0822973 [Tanacetum coccineum]|uniref:Uncharacterized protein n=1 Tax=Tanacetum coccineum TaxID=301880 RepID=A0ABQ5AIE3_9ASTR